MKETHLPQKITHSPHPFFIYHLTPEDSVIAIVIPAHWSQCQNTVKRCYSVTAALDISKAVDTVCHTKLFQCLVDTGVSGWIVLVIENWYSKLCVAVRWTDATSKFFNVMSWVRQGNILSPW